tara:strand:- start:3061 stop:5001 length:1941 start_codon:yes stop_codon:yes gene_type:complete
MIQISLNLSVLLINLYNYFGDENMKRMFIKESTLRKVIRKFLIEATGTSAVTRVAKKNPKGKPPASRATTDAEHALHIAKTKHQQSLSGWEVAQKDTKTAKDTLDRHTADEPASEIPDTTRWKNPITGDVVTLGQGETQPDKAWSYRQATTQDVPDTTKWIHPYSSQTTTLGQGETQPAKGWQYRQATTTTDSSKWIHPYSSQTTTLSKGQTQPKFGWEYGTQTAQSWTHPTSKQTVNLPSPKAAIPALGWSVVTGGKGGKTKYGVGSAQDYAKAQKTLQPGQQISKSAPTTVNYGKAVKTFGQGTIVGLGGYQELSDLIKKGGGVSPDRKTKVGSLADPKKTTNPTSTSYATQYGQGTDSDYSTAQTVSGRDQFTSAKATTNPTTQQTSYATNYGYGSASDLSTAQGQPGRDQWSTGDTTNPNIDNPEWSDWSDKKAEYTDKHTSAQSAESSALSKVTQDADTVTAKDIDLQKSREKDEESFGKRATIDVPKTVAKGGTASAKGGWGSGKSSGKGRGRGRGRGAKGKGRGKGRGRAKGSKGKKGKKSKKDESLMIRNNIISETVKPRRSTVKEIKVWMKTLEENRYKKIPHADARRVAWFVNNNLAEDYEQMPKSIVKKWSKAAYGRERYLAKEYLKHKEELTKN